MKRNGFGIVLIFASFMANSAQAQQYGSNLCNLLEHAHLTPTEFHLVFEKHKDLFTPGMMQYIQNRGQLMIQRAGEHDQSCNQFPPYSPAYHQCKANNLPRQYAIYLGSLWQFVNTRIAWPQTEYGRIAMEGLQMCQMLGNCPQMKNMALGAIRHQCLGFLN